MKAVGHVRKVDLGAGGWMLACDDGRRFELVAAAPGLLAEGRAEVEGDVDTSAVSTLMVGPVLRVQKARRL